MEQFSCPKCSYENPKGSVSCKRCLLIFAKYEKKVAQMNSIGSAQVLTPQKLEDQWKEILADYDNLSKHEAFVAESLKAKQLPYASQQYKKMVDLNGADIVAKKMIDKIIQVATLTYVPPFRKEPPKSTRWITVTIFFVVLFGLGVAIVTALRHNS